MTEIDHSKRGHSPLGASGAERWMSCPGSVALLKELQLPESDDPSYRIEGTAMHEAAEHCLKNGLDTWEIVGETFSTIVIDAAMADAVQVYLDVCRADKDIASTTFVEYRISSPVHESFYGTADWVALISKAGRLSISEMRADEERLVIADLKGGQGIIVEPDDNPQLKYYAFGVIDGMERSSGQVFDDTLKVVLRIVQPRAYHDEGCVREWETTVGEIKEWVHDTLVPAMARAEIDNTLEAGPWCRFCAAKLVCPLLTSLFRAAATSNPQEIINYSDASIARSYQYVKAVKFYLKALEDETYRRLNMGIEMTGSAKLVAKKANRVFKDGALEAIKAAVGDEAFTAPALKSPAELEKVSPAAKALVKEWAYMPSTGLTVAMWDDPKPAVKVQTSTEAFGAAVAQLVENTDAA